MLESAQRYAQQFVPKTTRWRFSSTRGLSSADTSRQQIIMLSLTKSDTQVTQRAEDKLEE
jgi:hypothetical protein